ncbi:MAG: hypothetical protein JSU79_03320 [Dehalococcoidales bacterium]|nr:MAG: hypothetical protein JSU79_03320 [Dehalococcoidales bacterium]
MSIELLINPFCLGDRDYRVISEKCRQYGLSLIMYNLWDIDDEEVDSLPEYISCLVREWRSGEKPGSVYSNLFINGERIPINNWLKSFDDIEERLRVVSKNIKT